VKLTPIEILPMVEKRIFYSFLSLEKLYFYFSTKGCANCNFKISYPNEKLFSTLLDHDVERNKRKISLGKLTPPTRNRGLEDVDFLFTVWAENGKGHEQLFYDGRDFLIFHDL